MMKKLMLSLLFSSALLVSCKDEPTDIPINKNPDDFKDMVVDDSFDWSNTQDITLSVEGLVTNHPVTRTLYVYNADGNVLAKRLTAINESFDLTFSSAAATHSLIVRYNTIVDTVEVSNGQASFSFIPAGQPGDEE